jgi:hypothetical protein
MREVLYKSFNTVGYYLYKCLFFIRGIFGFLDVLYSTLLHLPPLTFHCVGGCWIELRTVATLALAVRHSNHSTIDLIHLYKCISLQCTLCLWGGKFEVNRLMARGDGEKEKKLVITTRCCQGAVDGTFLFRTFY